MAPVMSEAGSSTSTRPRIDRAVARRVVTLAPSRRAVPTWVTTWARRNVIELVDADQPVQELFQRVALLTAAGDHVLVVRGEPWRGGTRVAAAVGHLPVDEPVADAAGSCAAALDATVDLLHGVPLSFGPRSVGLDAAVSTGEEVVQAARVGLAAQHPRTPVEARLLRVHPHELVNELLDADLLVVGGAGEDRQLGRVALSAIQHAPCPVLVVPRRTG